VHEVICLLFSLYRMLSSSTTRLGRAVQNHRILSRQGLRERLFTVWFRGLVYTQIWEDPRVDAAALQLDETSRIPTIASAGCNVLNYPVHDPAHILAVDVHDAPLALQRLRIAALRHLPSHDSFFQFFGVGVGPENVEAYHRHIRPHLDENTRHFWESRPLGGLRRPRITAFEEGFYDHGILPSFQNVASVLSQLLQNRRPAELLEATSLAEQRQFFDECVAPFFDHRLVQWVAERPTALYSLGIPPRQFRSLVEGEEDAIVDVYRTRLERLVCGFPLSENYFAWQAFGRRYDTRNREALPAYLRAEHHAQLRYHLDRIDTQIASFTDALRDQPDSSFDSFVLLDAMDWMDREAIVELWTEISRVGTPGARIIFRTAGRHSIVEPALPDALRARFSYERARSEALHTKDRSAVYGMFHLYVFTG
jgi:S-adenosylmethionine-diacylglycerol 3-amino-3-carboxypropyl transferase